MKVSQLYKYVHAYNTFSETVRFITRNVDLNEKIHCFYSA